MHDPETGAEDSTVDRPITRRGGQRLLIVGCVVLVPAIMAVASNWWVLANIGGAVAIVLLIVGVTNMILGNDE